MSSPVFFTYNKINCFEKIQTIISRIWELLNSSVHSLLLQRFRLHQHFASHFLALFLFNHDFYWINTALTKYGRVSNYTSSNITTPNFDQSEEMRSFYIFDMIVRFFFPKEITYLLPAFAKL